MQPGSSGRRAIVIVAFVVLATTIPFARKAIHIDDVYFIEVAANILEDPRRPFAGAVALEDIDYRVFAAVGRCPSTFESMSHPPLAPYVIALVGWAAGGFSELPLHLAFVLFALGAGLAAHSLARRFTDHALATTLLLVSSPIFILSAQSLATDMAALAFSLGALALVVEGIDQERREKVVFGGLLAGLAVLTRYGAFPTVLLLLVYGIARGRPKRALPALVGVALVLGAWSVQNLVYDGQLHILASGAHYRRFYQDHSFDWPGLVKKALSDLSGLGGTAFVAAGLLLCAWRRWLVFSTAALAVVTVFRVRPWGIEGLEKYTSIEMAAVALCFACGVLLVVESLSSQPRPPAPGSRDAPSAPGPEARDRGDQAFLVAWLATALAVTLVLLPFGTARYMLPALPPLWLLIVRRVERAWGEARVLRPAFMGAIAQGLLLAAVLSLGDYEHAARYRALAQSVRANHPERTIWFVGEWGFRYYMNTVGGRYLRSAAETPQTGDIIVRPSIAGMHEMSADVRQRAERVQEIALESRWPIRLMSFEARAGYYSHHWGYLPWTFSHAPLERIEIFEVRGPAPRTEAPPCESS